MSVNNQVSRKFAGLVGVEVRFMHGFKAAKERLPEGQCGTSLGRS
jgi:hypothetical protein